MKRCILPLLTLATLMSAGAGAATAGTPTNANLASGCDGTETFVYVPYGADRLKYLADYVKTHTGPSDAELARCHLTRDQWRAQVLAPRPPRP